MKTTQNKPPYEQYQKWLEERHNVHIDVEVEDHYRKVSNRIIYAYDNSDIWKNIISNIQVVNDEYLLKTGFPLFMSLENPPRLVIKSYDSFILKTYRKNILENPNWPNEPEKGWFLPSNWYSKINDIVRTMLIVKYLDGVEFLCDRINGMAANTCQIQYEAKDVGYYAAHLYLKNNVEIPSYGLNTINISTQLEIQITTQIQENIRKLLHKYYNEKRVKEDKKDVAWQWNYNSEEFSVNYLGHILHYVEGMIMEIRNRRDEK